MGPNGQLIVDGYWLLVSGYAAGLPVDFPPAPRSYKGRASRTPWHSVPRDGEGHTHSRLRRKHCQEGFTAKTQREARLNPSETDLPRFCEACAMLGGVNASKCARAEGYGNTLVLVPSRNSARGALCYAFRSPSMPTGRSLC